MRIFGVSLAVVCCVSSATPGTAQKAGGNVVSADQKEIGKLQTRILKYEQALGVVIQLARPSGADVECNGVCYFPSSSRPIAWKCEPDRKCDLHCTVNPPVGGCN